MSEQNRYQRIIEHVFLQKFRKGASEVRFNRGDIEAATKALGLPPVKNLGDLIYTFRYRAELPEAVRAKCPAGNEWRIVPDGTARYRFKSALPVHILPNPRLAEIKVPNATPAIIEMYALSDEQALLAKVRYNRLIDVFTGIVCYPLQSHLRTTVQAMGQIETDELYVGLDRHGAHYVIPVQAKGGRDRMSAVQIEQDIRMCAEKFDKLICRPIGAQFMEPDLIALFELGFDPKRDSIVIVEERHYRLVPRNEMSSEDLDLYRRQSARLR